MREIPLNRAFLCTHYPNLLSFWMEATFFSILCYDCNVKLKELVYCKASQITLQKGCPERKCTFIQTAFNLRLQTSQMKSPQPRIKHLCRSGSHFTHKSQNWWLRLLFFGTFQVQKALQGAGGSLSSSMQLSGCTPVCPESESGSLASTVTAVVTKASAGKDVCFGMSLLVFWGWLPSLFLSWENWDFSLLTLLLSQDAHRSSRQHGSCLETLGLNCPCLHKNCPKQAWSAKKGIRSPGI